APPSSKATVAKMPSCPSPSATGCDRTSWPGVSPSRFTRSGAATRSPWTCSVLSGSSSARSRRNGRRPREGLAPRSPGATLCAGRSVQVGHGAGHACGVTFLLGHVAEQAREVVAVGESVAVVVESIATTVRGALARGHGGGKLTVEVGAIDLAVAVVVDAIGALGLRVFRLGARG